MPSYIRVEGLDTKFINQADLKNVFAKFTIKIKEFTYVKNVRLLKQRFHIFISPF